MLPWYCFSPPHLSSNQLLKSVAPFQIKFTDTMATVTMDTVSYMDIVSVSVYRYLREVDEILLEFQSVVRLHHLYR